MKSGTQSQKRRSGGRSLARRFLPQVFNLFKFMPDFLSLASVTPSHEAPATLEGQNRLPTASSLVCSHCVSKPNTDQASTACQHQRSALLHTPAHQPSHRLMGSVRLSTNPLIRHLRESIPRLTQKTGPRNDGITRSRNRKKGSKGFIVEPESGLVSKETNEVKNECKMRMNFIARKRSRNHSAE